MVIYIGIVGVRFCKQIRREKKEKKMGLRSKMFVMVMVIGALGSAPLMVWNLSCWLTLLSRSMDLLLAFPVAAL
ncbi:hypothetical protein IC575_013419 [Cucumis melo]